MRGIFVLCAVKHGYALLLPFMRSQTRICAVFSFYARSNTDMRGISVLCTVNHSYARKYSFIRRQHFYQHSGGIINETFARSDR